MVDRRVVSAQWKNGIWLSCALSRPCLFPLVNILISAATLTSAARFRSNARWHRAEDRAQTDSRPASVDNFLPLPPLFPFSSGQISHFSQSGADTVV